MAEEAETIATTTLVSAAVIVRFATTTRAANAVIGHVFATKAMAAQSAVEVVTLTAAMSNAMAVVITPVAATTVTIVAVAGRLGGTDCDDDGNAGGGVRRCHHCQHSSLTRQTATLAKTAAVGRDGEGND